MSELTKGLDPTKSVKNSSRLNRISKRRACQFDDFFYKAVHYIVKFFTEHKIEVIVYGHNREQKQRINIGSGNNQNFVSVPYTRFYWILTCIAAKSGIPVIETEESYTSKASLADLDPIPVYREGKDPECTFSGKRISRGQYRARNGMNQWLHYRRQERKLFYFELFKASSVRDKSQYIEDAKRKPVAKAA